MTSTTTDQPESVFAAGQAADTPTLPGQHVRVRLSDGQDLRVRVSNRELVAWDMTRGKRSWPTAQEAWFLFLTFTSWKAATREGKTTLTFEQWQDAVEDLEDGAADDADPTNPGHAAS